MKFPIVLIAFVASLTSLPTVLGQTTSEVPSTSPSQLPTTSSNPPSEIPTSETSTTITSISEPSGTSSGTPSGSSTTRRPTGTSEPSGPLPSDAPDVYLHVPDLSVRRIELNVDNLQADINLNANVARLVTLNAGVALTVQKINITIADVEAKLDLVVRLGNLVRIVNRVFQSLDLNPMMVDMINTIDSGRSRVVGEVDGFLGSVSQRGTTVAFMVDNLGNIVQKVTGADQAQPAHKIVGDYRTNMTFTGDTASFANGLIRKRYAYDPFDAMVDIMFNSAGHVVEATVDRSKGESKGGK